MRTAITTALMALVAALVVGVSVPTPSAQAATDVESETIYQRGIHAAIWAMPAMSMEFFWDGAFRTYGPGQGTVEQTWEMPGLQKVN